MSSFAEFFIDQRFEIGFTSFVQKIQNEPRKDGNRTIDGIGLVWYLQVGPQHQLQFRPVLPVV